MLVCVYFIEFYDWNTIDVWFVFILCVYLFEFEIEIEILSF